MLEKIQIIILTSWSIFLIFSIQASSQPTEGQLLWKYETNGKIFGSAIIDQHNIYFGSGDGTLYALNRDTGVPHWAFQTGGTIKSTPVIYQGILYLLSGNGTFYAIDANSGQPVWTFLTEGEARMIRNAGTDNEFEDVWDYYYSDAVVSGDFVYFGSSDNHIYALERHSGELIWKFKTCNVVHATPVVDDGLVYSGSFDGYFYALDAQSGELVWKFNTVGSRFFPSGAVQKGAAIFGDTIYFGSRDGNLYALDIKSGTGHWNFKEIAGSWIIATPTVYDEQIYFGTSDSFNFYSLNTANGELNWKIDLNMRVFGSAAVHNATVFFGSMNGYVYGVDAETGKVMWRFQTDGSKEKYYSIYNEDDSFRSDFTLYGSTLQEVIDNEEKIHSMGSVLSTPLIQNGMIYFGSTDSTFYAVTLISE